MKTYIVYDCNGNEIPGVYIKARNYNEAEAKAKRTYGPDATVAYTEI